MTWRDIYLALESHGLDARAVFEGAGLDVDRLSDPDARFPVEAMARAWQQCVTLSGDECFGLSAGERWEPAMAHAPGFGWLASDTLDSALKRLVRWFRILRDWDGASLERVDRGMIVRLRWPEAIRATWPEQDASWTALVKSCRAVHGEAFSPISLRVERPEPGAQCRRRFEMYFRCPVAYAQPRGEMLISAADLWAPLPAANPEMALAADAIALAYLARLVRGDVVGSVMDHLTRELPGERPTLHTTARALALSPRTLVRRLKQEGVTFSDLVEEVRQGLAASYLTQEHVPMTEIAWRLGFSGQASFTRAFHRWYGVSPTQHRHRRRTQGADA